LSFYFKDTLTPGLIALKDKLKMGKGAGADFHVKSEVAHQFLTWCNNGSSNESTKPPIDTGNLRGSASIFVGPVCIQDTRGQEGVGTPATVGGESSMDVITIVYNTAYAARLHESEWIPGGAIPTKAVINNPAKVANVGNKWIEKHLKADAQNIFKLYAAFLKTEIEST